MFNVSGSLFYLDMKLTMPYPRTLLGSDRIQQYYLESRSQYFLGMFTLFHTTHVGLPGVVIKSLATSDLTSFSASGLCVVTMVTMCGHHGNYVWLPW